MSPPTTQKAACDGSPGTTTIVGLRSLRLTVTVRPASELETTIRAPIWASNSSVWARVGTGSWTTVSPAAARPASRRADFTWALAIGGVYSMPWRSPPVTANGGRHRGPWPVTFAPIRSSGSATRSMGRPRREASPVRWAVTGSPATRPNNRRIPVPELPRSIGPSGGWSRDRPPWTRIEPPDSSTSAPRARIASRVRCTSSPSERPVMVVVPSASAASSRARWEMDLSPGTRSVPTRARPPVTSKVSGLIGWAPPEHWWSGSRDRPGRPGVCRWRLRR